MDHSMISGAISWRILKRNFFTWSHQNCLTRLINYDTLLDERTHNLMKKNLLKSFVCLNWRSFAYSSLLCSFAVFPFFFLLIYWRNHVETLHRKISASVLRSLLFFSYTKGKRWSVNYGIKTASKSMRKNRVENFVIERVISRWIFRCPRDDNRFSILRGILYQTLYHRSWDECGKENLKIHSARHWCLRWNCFSLCLISC